MAESFGVLLRRHRLALGLTQEALAEKAGMSSQAVGALERGDRRFPHQHTVARLAAALALTDHEHTRFATAARRRRTPREAAPDSVPYQLPTDIAHFTGRGDDIDRLAGLLARPSAVAVAGMGGVGKTALAVHVGHQVAELFPDGQLYLDLRGTGSPMPARDAAARLMRALGVAADAIPHDLAEAAARLRTCLASRRVLLILDNAACADQVAPLIPGSGASAAIITSRLELGALSQVHHLRLDVLPERDAVALLASTIGGARVAAEPESARAVVRHCAGLPLAIHLVGARLAVRPGWPVGHLAERLADERRVLDELEREDVGVRASFAVTIDRLAKTEARAYALFGLIDTPELSLPVVARLLDTGETDAERLLERLADLHVVVATTPGRYRMHDLLRAHARERAGEILRDGERAAAVGRVLDLLTAVAWRSLRLVVRDGVRHAWADEAWTASAPPFDGAAGAFAWLDEHRQLVADIVNAPDAPAELLVRLACGLFMYYVSRGYWLDWHRVTSTALAAAPRTGDRLGAAILRMDVGLALADLAHSSSGGFDEAFAHLEHSLGEFRAIGHDHATAMCLMNLADVLTAADAVDEGIARAEEALAICERPPESTGGIAVACENLGNLHRRRGDHEQALAHYERSLRHCVASGHSLAEARVLERIGTCHRATGDHVAARAALERSAEVSRRLGDAVGETGALDALGGLHLDRGDHTAAVTVLSAALALADPHEHPRGRADIQRRLGVAAHALGRRAEARAHWLAALTWYERHGETAEAETVRGLIDG